MDFNDTQEEAEFRALAKAFLEAHANRPEVAPPAQRENEAQYLKRAKVWQKMKYDNGWACLRWSKEFGGRGASPMEGIIWQQEESRHDLPTGPFAIGQGMCGPTMMAYAQEQFNRELMPKMASGEEIWCQLFSEPAGGSDLANLRTKAIKDGDDWIINGQKTWTSGAQFSDWGILVTRSDPSVPKHKGLTFFFLSMHSDGVEVKPIKQVSGGTGFNEVYFTDVRIPDSQRLGDVGDGWRVSLTTLMNERLAVGSASGPDFQAIFDLACQVEMNGKPAVQDGAVRAKLADWYCQMSGLKYTKARAQSALSRGETPGPENSITKVVSANKLQQIGSFGMELLDMGGIMTSESQLGDRTIFHNAFMAAPGFRIAGGTDEILRNIIAERVLGLPPDVRVDKGIPFSEVPQGSG